MLSAAAAESRASAEEPAIRARCRWRRSGNGSNGVDGQPAYVPPPLSLFEDPAAQATMADDELMELAHSLEDKLERFDITAKVVEIHPGPVITSFEVEPGSSTKVHQVVNLADDLALALKARSIRIVAPIPGKGTIGIEIPNRNPSAVSDQGNPRLQAFRDRPSPGWRLPWARTSPATPTPCDLESMPHLLIAGATGSGKSVCINSIITSLVCKNSPQQVQLAARSIPSGSELNLYEGIPHLVSQVVTEPKKAVRALGWVIEEMDLRYQLLASRGVRNIQSYEEGLPFIVVIIDELADLMLCVAPGDGDGDQQAGPDGQGGGHSPGGGHPAPVGGRDHRRDQGQLPVPDGLQGGLQDRLAHHHRRQRRRAPAGQGRHADDAAGDCRSR